MFECIPDRFDQRLLASFVAKFFCQESLNSSYPLIKDDASSLSIPLPQETTKAKYVEWVKQLPSNEKPTWLGLPGNAETVLLISEGKRKRCDECSLVRSAL
jgi:dynein heavy chain 1